ncbi:MAG: hypothetical protein U0359_14090 [Byssovorax sp.]
MNRPNSNIAPVLDDPNAEVPVFVGEGFEVFEGWGALTPEQRAECEQAEADLRSGRVQGVRHEDVQRTIAEMRAQQGE